MQKSKCKMKPFDVFLSVPPPPEGFLRCKNSRTAETILEVIIAVAVIMVILAPASALYISSMRNTAVNRNELIAAALAEEGLEIMRNIRDTNFIKFSDKTRDCWNTVPQPDPAQGECDAAANKIAAGIYKLSVNVDQASADYLKWTLNPTTEALHENADGKYDLAGNHDEEYRLALDGNTHLYYHAPPPLPGAPAPEPSQFYREITLQYSSDGNALSIASAVLFRSGTIVRAVLRHDILTQSPL